MLPISAKPNIICVFKQGLNEMFTFNKSKLNKQTASISKYNVDLFYVKNVSG